MPIEIIMPNEMNDSKCDQWIDKSCEMKNITLQDLYQVCGQVNQQLKMKEQLPPQMGGGELSDHECLISSWLSWVVSKLEQKQENTNEQYYYRSRTYTDLS